MDRYYGFGPVTLCLRSWPTDPQWPFAWWRLDSYATQGNRWDILAEYDPHYPIPEGSWEIVENSVTALRQRLCLPNGERFWRQIQKRGGSLTFCTSGDYSHIRLIEDTTATYGMAAIEALSFFVFPAMLSKGVLPLHGAVVEHRGRGILFCGLSGAGKSTQARLWRQFNNALILNSDRAPCYEKEGRWYAFGTPWCGTGGEHICREVPVKAVVLPVQSSENRVHVLTGQQLLEHLLPQVLCPDQAPLLQMHMFELLDRFLSCVPVLQLECTLDRAAVETLAGYLENLE